MNVPSGERGEPSPGLEVRLFGKFRALWSGRVIKGLQTKKAQELFAYLLVDPGRPHLRENLAGKFWDARDADPRKNLRQTLWQLQSALTAATGELKGLIEHQGSEWIRFHSVDPIRCDVHEFREVVAKLEQVPGAEITPNQAHLVDQVVGLYGGDFMEGCYQDWCLFERERLRDGYLLMLDKMMSYCEVRKDFRTGIDYGILTLREDGARERTHRRLMRLQYFAGDRTAALRQYERCVFALESELDVGPARRTQELLNDIKADHLSPWTSETEQSNRAAPARNTGASLLEGLVRLNRLLSDARREVYQEIRALERARRARE